MVLILSDKENKTDKKLIENLSHIGASVVSENSVLEFSPLFTAVNRHNTIKVEGDKGIVIVTGNIKKFKNQYLPQNFIGVCAENNKTALRLFKKNNLSVITCGVGNKNTLSVSSITEKNMLLCLQRSITDINGNVLEPCEIKIGSSLKNDLFACLATVFVMLYYKIGNEKTDGLVF